MKPSHVIGITVLVLFLFNCKKQEPEFDIIGIEKERIISKAQFFLSKKPVTVTDSFSKRSAGTKHDYFSEGDYWWPNPKDLNGEYIRKDGLTNPDNFTAHRKALLRLNQISGSLASAYLITKDKTYIKQLIPHLKAWFVNEDTKMNPSLVYAQAINCKVLGRGIGIIDTVHLTEIAQAISIVDQTDLATQSDINTMKSWFKDYLKWLQTHPFGISERDHGNNHSICWAIQVAAFARLVHDEEALQFCRQFYKETLLPEQMDECGGFPRELNRTKPYGYSLFVLDAMANLCQILTTEEENLFYYTTEDGRSIKLGLEFMYPFIEYKESWPYPDDVMYHDEWPVRQSALLFGGLHYKNRNYLALWESLDGNFNTPEIVRNMPVKFPLLWLE